MKDRCLRKIQELENLRSDLINEYDSYTHDQLLFSPEQDRWNLLQVLDHLIVYEKSSSIYMKRQLSAKKYPPAPGFKSKVHYKFYKISLVLPFRYKAPVIVDSSRKTPRLEHLKENWETIRKEIKMIVETTDEDLLTLGIYEHPRTGSMNMEQTLDFLKRHILRHKKQIRRLTGHERFPVLNINCQNRAKQLNFA